MEYIRGDIHVDPKEAIYFSVGNSRPALMNTMFYLQKVEDHRKKWDREEYEKLAQDRLEEELKALEPEKREAPVKRELLKPREYRVRINYSI